MAKPTQPKASPSPRRATWGARLWRALLQAGIGGLILAACGLGLLYHSVADGLPSLDTLEEARPMGQTLVHDERGMVIGRFARQRHLPTQPHPIPAQTASAFLAAEDAGFYRHRGIDPAGMLRALIANIKAGRIVQGGSTITQQLVRMSLLGGERSYRRKAREALLALRLENRMRKNRILALYLDRVYLGQGLYGVAAAAKGYFGKEPEALTLAESAWLAGLAQAPSRLSTFRHREDARDRQVYVLGRMVEAGWISGAEAERALGEKLVFLAPERNPGRGTFSYYAEHVRRLAEDRLGSERLLDGGLHIFTAQDPRLQEMAEDAVRQGLAELAIRRSQRGESRADDIEGALVCLENATGRVRALVGGRDFTASPFNRATQALRQPGSAFKPFLYAAALEAGYSPAHMLVDEPVEYPDRDGIWRPQNYGGGFVGPMTLFESLVQSRNVIAVRLMQDLGARSVIALAGRLGLGRMPAYPSLALGSVEVTLLDLTAAFAAFPNQGRYRPPIFIDNIIDDRDNLLPWDKPVPARVLSPETAYQILFTLEAAVERGTGRNASARGLHLAGKTGTTDNWTDAWFVGFSPEYTVGVWVGRDRHETLGRDEEGGRTAAPIFRRFMEQLPAGSATRPFPAPAGLVMTAVDPLTGYPADYLTENPLTMPLVPGRAASTPGAVVAGIR